jgi:hypothetical protein
VRSRSQSPPLCLPFSIDFSLSPSRSRPSGWPHRPPTSRARPSGRCAALRTSQPIFPSTQTPAPHSYIPTPTANTYAPSPPGTSFRAASRVVDWRMARGTRTTCFALLALLPIQHQVQRHQPQAQMQQLGQTQQQHDWAQPPRLGLSSPCYRAPESSLLFANRITFSCSRQTRTRKLSANPSAALSMRGSKDSSNSDSSRCNSSRTSSRSDSTSSSASSSTSSSNTTNSNNNNNNNNNKNNNNNNNNNNEKGNKRTTNSATNSNNSNNTDRGATNRYTRRSADISLQSSEFSALCSEQLELLTA